MANIIIDLLIKSWSDMLSISAGTDHVACHKAVCYMLCIPLAADTLHCAAFPHRHMCLAPSGKEVPVRLECFGREGLHSCHQPEL